jgi:UPF0755 protein
MKRKHLTYLISGLAIIALFAIFLFYRSLYGFQIRNGEYHVAIHIPTGASYKQTLDSLTTKIYFNNLKTFNWVAKKKNYPALIKPGKYIINREMSYIGLINLLRSGDQTQVKITFNNIRTLNELAGRIGRQIEADSAQIIAFLSDQENYRNDGFIRENVISVFIPNTYNFFWNTTTASFYNRMLKEYKKFWNEERLSKAREKNLSQAEVSILASIIDDEVSKAVEKPRIAGVYLNRLKRGIPLQACPTIKFALNDFTITRVLNKHLQVDSPYNTYRHSGFPPGPIGCPTIEGIDAVLNAEKHDYLYFAAKADFSGYHNFSRTLAEHNMYAASYQKELDKLKIFK